MSFTSRLKSTEFDPIVTDEKVQLQLDMSYCALRQRNFKLALTKLNETRHRLDSCRNPLMKSIYWNEIYCDVHIKRHQIPSTSSTLTSLLSTSVAKELKKLETKIHSLEIVDQQTARLNSNFIQLNSQFSRLVIDFLLVQPMSYESYEQNPQIPQAKHRQLEMYLQSNETIQQADILIRDLFNKNIDLLKDNIHKQQIDLPQLTGSIRQAKENLLSRDYNELASLCDDYLRRYENHEDDNQLLKTLFADSNDQTIAELIVRSILLSMKYGSNEGVQRFSRLLQIVDFYPQTMNLIEEYLNQIPCWMFFDCLYQITAYLDKPIALKLYPLIEQIVQIYPQAIVYPFKLSYETLQSSVTDSILKSNLENLNQQLNRTVPLVNEFIQALNQLNPQQEFDIWSKELFHLLANDSATRDIDKLEIHRNQFRTIFFDENNDSESKHTSIRCLFRKGIENEFNDLFGRNGELLSTLSLGDARLALGNISLKLKTLLQDKSNLNDYSTWFTSTFRQQHSSLNKLEIPGQYTSKKKPSMEHHIKIVDFDEKLLVLHSLRLPKRLTIRGHDENDYRFLVKAGEDIRQDQRIEALFTIMNDLYGHNSNCHQTNSPHINIRTYKVIPMSSKLGIIEWLDNTRPLKDLIEESYTDSEYDLITNQGQHPRKLYHDYVVNTYQKAKPSAKTTNNTLMYAELFLSLTKGQVQDEFQQIQSVVPADLLRRAYYKIANSHEGFYTLRRQFITSYAVLCTSQYILGIGDRHQSK